MSNYVQGEGNGSAKLALIGDMPSTDDDRSQSPFSGKTGNFLNQILDELGYGRNDFWLTNVIKYRPPGGDIDKLEETGTSIPKSLLVLRDELAEVGTNCAIAFGDSAMQMLTGKKGVTNWRGSIIQSPNGKVVPTFHPAAFLKTNKWGDSTAGPGVFGYYNRQVMKFDIQRAVEQSEFSSYRPPPRTLHVCKGLIDLHRFIERNKNKEYLSIDIEVIKAFPVCVGIAFTPHEAMSIPLLPMWGHIPLTKMGPAELARVWKLLGTLFLNPQFKKIGQNFKFDEDKLAKLGLPIDRLYFDTQLGSHTLDPELPKSLAFSTSTRTEEQFYKWEGREYKPGKDSFEVFQKYNCKDCCVTLEIALDEIAELKEMGMTSFYFDFVNHLHRLYLESENVGWVVNEKARDELTDQYQRLWMEKQVQLDVLVNCEINVKSQPQVRSLLFDRLHLAKRVKTDEDTLIAMLATQKVSEDKVATAAIQLILDIRKIRDQISRYIKARLDYDGRLRTVAKIAGTETGRTATGILQGPVRPHKIGIAMQTLTKHGEFGSDIRRMLVPDPGYVFLSVDQAQAEARVVALLAEDYDFLDLIDKVDVHKMTAGWVFDCSPEMDKKDVKRIIGKTVRHAGNYDMTKNRLCVLVTTDCKKQGIDYGISKYRAGEILDTFHDRTPRIRDNFHAQIQDRLNESRELTSPCSHIPGKTGRRRMFYERWNRELWKEAYAQIPQASVSDHTKGVALRVKDKIPDIRLLLEAHDGLDFLVPKAEAETYARVIRQEFLRPIDFSVCSLPRGELVIPVEVQIAEDNYRDFIDLELE
jgi:uracil-DNA glycosylase family 4|tara:strand:- start:2191 stop:4617 length:2427 start_codon:yes stop_codon:yes gene_type:complete